LDFCKRATDVAVVKFFIKFLTAREPNYRQTVDWMNSIKFKVSLLAKHWTYQTLQEGSNVSFVILPLEKYKLLNQGIQHSVVVDVKFFVIFFAAREWNDRQTVDGSNSMKFKTTFVGEQSTYLTLTE